MERGACVAIARHGMALSSVSHTPIAQVSAIVFLVPTIHMSLLVEVMAREMVGVASDLAGRANAPSQNGMAGRSLSNKQRQKDAKGPSQLGAYVKLPFWTNVENVLDLLPAAHPNGEGKFQPIAVPSGNYPTSWKHEAGKKDNKWFHLQIDFRPSTHAVATYLDGAKLGNVSIPVNMLEASNAP